MEERISVDKTLLYLSQMAFITFTEMHNKLYLIIYDIFYFL